TPSVTAEYRAWGVCLVTPEQVIPGAYSVSKAHSGVYWTGSLRTEYSRANGWAGTLTRCLRGRMLRHTSPTAERDGEGGGYAQALEHRRSRRGSAGLLPGAGHLQPGGAVAAGGGSGGTQAEGRAFCVALAGHATSGHAGCRVGGH